jgi:hypothetical protein
MTAALTAAARDGHLRHRLRTPAGTLPAAAQINDLVSLRAHLQTAIELEHATIPVYLCALYSMDPRRNAFAYQAVQGVVMEEMLHMLQAANLLNAIGGEPAINAPAFIPEYPTYLPHSDQAFLVPLQKFSEAAIDVFLEIEHPAADCAPPEADKYHTIGQFYHAIGEAMARLDATTPGGIFTGHPDRQLTPEHYYGGGGQLLPVRQLADAQLAIDEIVGQGEGADRRMVDSDSVMFGQEIEYAHYFRFMEVKCARQYNVNDGVDDPPSGAPVAVDWAGALDMRPNPKLTDYPEGSALWHRTRDFNRIYMQLLDRIHEACNGRPQQLMQAIPLMFELKYRAIALMNTPTNSGQMAGPSFEYLAPD